MKALLALIMRRRIHAIVATVLLALATPLMTWLSGAVVGLAVFSSFLDRALHANRNLVLAALMISSLRINFISGPLYSWFKKALPNDTAGQNFELRAQQGLGPADQFLELLLHYSPPAVH